MPEYDAASSKHKQKHRPICMLMVPTIWIETKMAKLVSVCQVEAGMAIPYVIDKWKKLNTRRCPVS